MDLFRPLERDGATLLSDQLAERIGHMIVSGSLKPGQYLPPLRLLANKLRVNVGTVVKAYAALRRQGLAAAASTRGLRVCQGAGPSLSTVGRPWADLVMPPGAPGDPLTGDLPVPVGARPVRFNISQAGVELMPLTLINRAFAAAMEDRQGFGYAPLSGLPEVRGAIERYLRRRDIAFDGATMLLTAGTAQSLAIITRALVPPGGVVIAEHPTWPVALSVFAAAGARVIALPVDDHGMQISSLADAVLRYNPAFLYLQPAFQNPTGLSLSAERRTELLAMARRFQLLVVEDDFASELAFGAPLPSLHTGTDADVVIYLKSFSKLIAPALRVSIMLVPSRYAPALCQAQHGLDPFVSALAQRVVAACLMDEGFEEHLRSMTAALQERWVALSAALTRSMPSGVRWTTPRGGLSAWLQLPARMRADDIVRDAAKRGLGLAPGRIFCIDESGQRGVRLSFGALAPAEIERGVDILAEVLEAHARGRRRREHLLQGIMP
jgi:GntR family transcriptional regulator